MGERGAVEGTDYPWGNETQDAQIRRFSLREWLDLFSVYRGQEFRSVLVWNDMLKVKWIRAEVLVVSCISVNSDDIN